MLPQPVMALATVLIMLVSFFKLSIQVCHGRADLSDIIPSPLVRPLGPLESPAAQTEFIIPQSAKKLQDFFTNYLKIVFHERHADPAIDRI